jgi:hypothetical protein
MLFLEIMLCEQSFVECRKCDFIKLIQIILGAVPPSPTHEGSCHLHNIESDECNRLHDVFCDPLVLFFSSTLDLWERLSFMSSVHAEGGMGAPWHRSVGKCQHQPKGKRDTILIHNCWSMSLAPRVCHFSKPNPTYLKTEKKQIDTHSPTVTVEQRYHH